jgi:hypothetical protein
LTTLADQVVRNNPDQDLFMPPSLEQFAMVVRQTVADVQPVLKSFYGQGFFPMMYFFLTVTNT